jgi:integrase
LTLEWRNGVVASGSLTVPKSKTAAGKGRLVPFTQRVCGVLTLWLERFPDAGPDSYLFPRHQVVMDEGREPVMFGVELHAPMGEWKRSWRRALRLAGVEYRWHDLRHTFVSRLAESPAVSEETIRSLAGHVSKKMLERYSHIRTQSKVAAISVLEKPEGGAQIWAQSAGIRPGLPN